MPRVTDLIVIRILMVPHSLWYFLMNYKIPGGLARCQNVLTEKAVLIFT